MVVPSAYKGREQSYVKHRLLQHYLERVLWVTLSPNSSYTKFVYVDGFSGPWKSQGENYDDTSFALAIALLRRVRSKYQAVEMRCVFVEEDRRAFDQLNAAVGEINDIDILTINGKFEEKVGEIVNWIGPDRSTFVLTFVDPKGWIVDLNKLRPLLSRQPGEVIYNFMHSFVTRFLTHPDDSIRQSYALPLGPNWENELDKSLPPARAVLQRFTKRLKDAGRFKYVLKHEVLKPTVDATHFYLFYGTRHRKGMIEFRKSQADARIFQEEVRHEAKSTKRQDRTGQGDFLFDAGLDSLTGDRDFHDAEMRDACTAIYALLANRSGRVSYKDVVDYVLERHQITESDLSNLLHAERASGFILIEGLPPRKRKLESAHVIVRTPKPRP